LFSFFIFFCLSKQLHNSYVASMVCWAHLCHTGVAAGLVVTREAGGALSCNVRLLLFNSCDSLSVSDLKLCNTHLFTRFCSYANALWAVQAAAAAQSGVLAASYRVALLNH
jgi:hypothetical protein